MEAVEAEQVRLDAFAGVIGTRVGAEDERPVARLCEQSSRAVCFSARSRSAVGLVNFLTSSVIRSCATAGAVNPLVLFVEPDAVVTFLAPARRGGRGDLVGRMAAEILFRRDQLEGFWS